VTLLITKAPMRREWLKVTTLNAEQKQTTNFRRKERTWETTIAIQFSGPSKLRGERYGRRKSGPQAHED